LLTKLRNHVKRIFESIALAISKTGIGPNTITLFSLVFSFLAFLSIYLHNSKLLFFVFLMLLGLMDVLDGSLARVTGKVTAFGGFLDSTIDRVSDALILYSLKYFGFRDELVVMLIVVSLMISYTRARAEALGVKMEGIGIIERAERILFVAGIAVLSLFSYFLSISVFLVFLVLSIVTLLHRIIYVYMVLCGSGSKNS